MFAGKANDEEGYCIRNGVVIGRMCTGERIRRRIFFHDSDCRE